MKENLKTIGIIALILGILVSIIYFKNKEGDKEKMVNNLLEAIGDTVKHYKNSLGEHVAKISVIETENSKQLHLINSRDSIIMWLQSEVKQFEKENKNLKSMVVFESQGTVEKQTPTVVDTTNRYKPIYTSNYSDNWIGLYTKASYDSTEFKLTYKSRYAVGIAEEKGKKYVEVIDKNPYNTTGAVRAYQIVDPPKNKFSLGVSAGFGIHYGLQYQKVDYGPFIGTTASYNFITF